MLVAATVRLIYLTMMFLAGLVLSNLVLPGHFGTISLMVLNASLLSIVTGFGTESFVLHKVSNQNWKADKATQFTVHALIVQLLLFVVLELGSLMIWHTTLLSNEAPSYLLADVVFFLGLLLTEKYIALLYAFHRARVANWLLAAIALFYLLLLLLVPYMKSVSLLMLMNIFVGQSLAQGLALTVFFYWQEKPRVKNLFKLREFFQLLSVSSLVMLANVIQLLAYRVDFWLIKFFYSNYELGIYAQANKFANLAWLVPNILTQLLIPKFSQLPQTDISKIFSIAFYSNFLNIAATIVCATLFYILYLDPAYKAGLTAFYLMLPGYFFWASVLYFSAYFSWRGKFLFNLYCSSFCLILILAADLLLIPHYGIEGAAVANSIAYTAVFLVYLFILRTRYSFRWKDLILPQKHFLKIVKLVSR